MLLGLQELPAPPSAGLCGAFDQQIAPHSVFQKRWLMHITSCCFCSPGPSVNKDVVWINQVFIFVNLITSITVV